MERVKNKLPLVGLTALVLACGYLCCVLCMVRNIVHVREDTRPRYYFSLAESQDGATPSQNRFGVFSFAFDQPMLEIQHKSCSHYGCGAMEIVMTPGCANPDSIENLPLMG
ncbi:hypothetical protein BDR03DRAFT_550401 [Suillus americanus]|nr:hypothetical protein BDR03DRAFT_550401 [Suillus americanus]